MTAPEWAIVLIGGFFLLGAAGLGFFVAADWWERRQDERRALPDRHRIGL